jgi:hypothetical protein
MILRREAACSLILRAESIGVYLGKAILQVPIATYKENFFRRRDAQWL